MTSFSSRPRRFSRDEIAALEADLARFQKVDVAPDPRISNLRPGWLADQHWRDQLQAMDLDDDIRWIENHWRMAGGAEPRVDTSWVTTEYVGSPDSPLLLFIILPLLVLALVGLLVGTGLMRA